MLHWLPIQSGTPATTSESGTADVYLLFLFLHNSSSTLELRRQQKEKKGVKNTRRVSHSPHNDRRRHQFDLSSTTSVVSAAVFMRQGHVCKVTLEFHTFEPALTEGTAGTVVEECSRFMLLYLYLFVLLLSKSLPLSCFERTTSVQKSLNRQVLVPAERMQVMLCLNLMSRKLIIIAML